MDAQERTRFEENGKEWAVDKAEFVPHTHVHIFDGKIGKTQFMAGALGFPIALFGGHADYSEIPNYWIHPLVAIVYRPFSYSNGMFPSKTLTLTDKNATVENNPVIVLDHGKGDVWVDPAKDYLPVRYTLRRGGVDLYRMVLSYKNENDNGWLPQAWTIERLDSNGQTEASESATVAGFAINKPIADSEFELDLSSGAILEHESNGTITQSIIYPDGKQRPFKPGEFNGKNFQDLLNSEPDSK